MLVELLAQIQTRSKKLPYSVIILVFELELTTHSEDTKLALVVRLYFALYILTIFAKLIMLRIHFIIIIIEVWPVSK